MAVNLEVLLPAAGGVVVSILVAYGNLRKSRAEATASGQVAGAETAKGQYAIWEQEWKNIVGSLERRLTVTETSERRMFEELADLRSKYEDCSEKLKRVT